MSTWATVAVLFMAAFLVTLTLLVIAIGGNANIVRENRRLRADLARRHPALRVIGNGRQAGASR